MKVSGLHVFENHLSLGINEVPIHGACVVIDFFGETKILTKLSQVGLGASTTIEQFMALEDTHWAYLGKPSEIELIEENGVKGWRLYQRNPEHYGNIGQDAVDFSITDGGFPESGATGVRSFAKGFNSHSKGAYSNAEGLTTVLSVELITGPIGGGGPGEVIPEGAYTIYGAPEGSVVYYGVPEGSVVYYGVPEGAITYYGVPA